MNNPAMGESVDRMASLVANCLPQVSKDKDPTNTNELLQISKSKNGCLVSQLHAKFIRENKSPCLINKLASSVDAIAIYEI